MKIFHITFLLINLNLIAQVNCEIAFSAANYSISHTEKAYEANNIKHTQEWAARAEETLQEVEQLTLDCGCNEASEYAYQAYEASSNSLSQTNWEQSRFYAKRAYTKAKLMIDELSICTNVNVDEMSNFSGQTNNVNKGSSLSLDEEQEMLLAEQKYLEEQQKILQQKIEAQKKAKEALNNQRALELKKQQRVKMNADAAMIELKNGYQAVFEALGCSESFNFPRSKYSLTQEELELHSLEETKNHYKLKMNAISQKAQLEIANCLSN